jgi:hypothetical protein
MVRENVTWGEERIADELSLKLGIYVSPRTIRKYWPQQPGIGSGRRRSASQHWKTFVRNHAQGIVACDFLVAVTARFRILFVFVALEIGSRRILHCNVTAHPTAEGTVPLENLEMFEGTGIILRSFSSPMLSPLTALFATLASVFRSRSALQLENLALRHQIGVLQRAARKRPKLTPGDRLLWVWLSRIWSGWRSALAIVKPETVMAWHRVGFRLFWTWKVRRGRPGRPVVAREVRDLIRRMCRENPSWGAPRVHGELLKLGIDIGETSVSKYMVRCRKPPSQTWRTFLENHVQQLVSIDFFTVPTLRFQVL